ncbi:hypothetical protein GL218_00369 [Daldinia childiae]|uniref:uncharacterized protein n=1 Tax=Daldinia childiae TaxID=326645 RepID=UPI001445F7E7|nr:uncharacterized protein GL218_00369 [Daldinia childiae]KAF3070941.1 hypothetical protein GL218_00369 [Daldinia childiae]
MSGRRCYPHRARFERELRCAQEHDIPISGTTFTAIRFRFNFYKDIRQIIVSSEINHPLPPPSTSPLTLPKFILSQLEAQRVADPNRIPPQLSVILELISGTLSKKPTRGKAFNFPTLFRYYHGEWSKTYLVYAYLDLQMESRKYTIAELQQLKTTYCRDALDKLCANHEVAEIFKGLTRKMPAQVRYMKKSKEDMSSSTESDEIIFHGKKNNRTQWQYKGRTGSEVSSKEPLPAPAGLVAQQSEGFQRFFKAVVSPTHVRVTAGGRIVPNTRGSVSPTAKWDKEHSATNGLGSTEASKDEKPHVTSGATNQFPQAQIPLQFPTAPGYFQHMGLPMPLYPVPHGIPMAFGMPTLPFAHSGGKQPTPTQSQQDIDEAAKEVKTQDGAGDKKPRPAPIKITPRDQFEQNRPFYHNGNVIYPPAYGLVQGQMPMPMMLSSPCFPPGVVGHLGPVGPQMGAFGSMGQPSPAASMFSPAAIASPHFNVPHAASGGARSVQPTSAPSQGTTPHITSIRPSEITKRQLDALKTSLKYYEDQLQYNRHQIDEKWTEEQADKLRESVQQFEQNYKMQANFEASYYPQVPTGSTSSTQQGTFWKTPTGSSSVRSRRGGNTSQNSSVGVGDQGRNLSHFQSSERTSSRHGNHRNSKVIGINSSKGNTSPLSLDPALEALIQEKMRRGLAAPEPMKNMGSYTDVSSAPTFDGAPHSFATQSEGINLGPQAGFSNTHGIAGWPSLGMMPFDQSGNWNNMFSTNSNTANRASAVNSQPSSASFAPNSHSRPYLVGTLPRGVNPHIGHGAEYVYSRELTAEEKRARSNYWGHVPNVGFGLPKFDGKDFYPPSPAKATRGAEASQSTFRPTIPTGRPDIDFGFRIQPTENDPFRPSHGTQKISKAIPIVAPDDASRGGASKKDSASQGLRGDNTDGFSNKPKSNKAPSPTASSEIDKKQDSMGRRTVERSSNKSGNDLWQTMLKRGPTSGAVVPSTVSSTTATGYLPQYHGHAAASLGPAISNTSNMATRASPEAGDKSIEYDVQRSAEKVGENCPPNETRSADYDPLKDVQERMLRDAERRGVVGSDW